MERVKLFVALCNMCSHDATSNLVGLPILWRDSILLHIGFARQYLNMFYVTSQDRNIWAIADILKFTM